MGEDDEVGFRPIPGSPNSWRLVHYAAGGVPLPATHEVKKIGKDGKEHTEQEFIDVIPSAVRAHHARWKMQEKDKEIRNAQTFKHLGQSPEDLTLEAATRLHALFAQRGAPLPVDDATPYGTSATTKQHRADTLKLSEYVNNPANHLQTFEDFIEASR